MVTVVGYELSISCFSALTVDADVDVGEGLWCQANYEILLPKESNPGHLFPRELWEANRGSHFPGK